MHPKRVALLLAVLLLLALLAGRLLDSPGPDSRPDTPARPADAPEDVAGIPTRTEAESPPAVPDGVSPGEPGDPAPEEPGTGPGPAATGGKETALPPGCFLRLGGRVVDVDTGEPVPGARVLYGPFPWWRGDDAGPDGSFRFEMARAELEGGKMFRLRVFASGYEPFDAVPREADLQVELRPRTRPLRYGRITGRAEDRDGRPLSGCLQVRLSEGETSRHYLTVVADEHGDFGVDGVEPGGWTISLERGGEESVFVPEGGEAEVVVRARAAAEDLEFDEGRRQELERLHAAFGAALERLASQRPEAEREVRGLATLISTLETARRRGLPRFPVRITGLGGRDGDLVVAEYHDSASTERWRTVVSDGTAVFPALFAGTWHLELRAPDEDREVKVEVSEGATSVPFPPRQE